MKILITGGGSGGHVSPALAVAKQLQHLDPQVELLYIGGTMTMEGATGPSVEERLVSQTDIPFVAISAGKLKRDGLSLNTLKRLWGVVPGFFQAFHQVKTFNPHIVFSTGGYVSIPVVMAAWILRKPIVIHEQTAAVGLANTIASKMATKVAITFPQSAQYFNASKVVETGNPLNAAIKDPVAKQELDDDFAQWLTKQSKPILYVTGGGLGSHVLNLAIESSLEALLERFAIIHQTGSNEHYADFERLSTQRSSMDKKQASQYWISKHVTPQQIGWIYKQSQMVISRAGANTVLELAYWSKPTIFVPIPWVTHDEQTKNAQALVDTGVAIILPEPQLNSTSLRQAIDTVSQIQVTPTIKKRTAQLVKVDADVELAKLVLKTAKR